MLATRVSHFPVPIKGVNIMPAGGSSHQLNSSALTQTTRQHCFALKHSNIFSHITSNSLHQHIHRAKLRETFLVIRKPRIFSVAWPDVMVHQTSESNATLMLIMLPPYNLSERKFSHTTKTESFKRYAVARI